MWYIQNMIKGFNFSNLANNVHSNLYIIGYVDDNTLILTFIDNETAEEVLHEAQEALTSGRNSFRSQEAI